MFYSGLIIALLGIAINNKGVFIVGLFIALVCAALAKGEKAMSNGKIRGYIREPYAPELTYNPMQEHETRRACYVHPQNPATHWELNKADRSYKRPVCQGCAQ